MEGALPGERFVRTLAHDFTDVALELTHRDQALVEAFKKDASDTLHCLYAYRMTKAVESSTMISHSNLALRSGALGHFVSA